MVTSAMAHGQVLTWDLRAIGSHPQFGPYNISVGSGQFTLSGGSITSWTGTYAGKTVTFAAPGSGLDGSGDNNWPLTTSGVVFSFPQQTGPFTTTTIFVTIKNIQNGPLLNANNNVLWGESSGGWEPRTLITNYSSVPEPSTYAALAAIGSLGFGVWRKARR